MQNVDKEGGEGREKFKLLGAYSGTAVSDDRAVLAEAESAHSAGNPGDKHQTPKNAANDYLR